MHVRPTAAIAAGTWSPTFLSGRIECGAAALKDRERRLPNGALHELRKFHYDTAGAANAGALASLLKLVSVAQVLFGTDFPPGGSSVNVAKSLVTLGFSDADMRAIDRDNALILLPRFTA